MNPFTSFADRIIAKAGKPRFRGGLVPYFDLPGYMERWWVVGRLNAQRQNDNDYFDSAKAKGGLYEWITDRIAVRLHHILRGDNDRHMHNHPYWSVSLVLRGGYFEWTPSASGERCKWRGPGAIVFRRASALHRLELPPLSTTWTIFILGRKSQNWGFLVPWREYSPKPEPLPFVTLESALADMQNIPGEDRLSVSIRCKAAHVTNRLAEVKVCRDLFANATENLHSDHEELCSLLAEDRSGDDK